MLLLKYQHVSKSSIRAAALSPIQFTSPLSIRKRTWGLCLSLADGDGLATKTSKESSGDSKGSFSENQVSAVNTSSLDSHEVNSTLQTSFDDSGPQASEASNGSVVSSDEKQDGSSSPIVQSARKRSPLTARDRLRAARVLSRYNEAKASKSEMGSKVLDALKESDRGKKKKKSGLPEAPLNLLDDSKRGLPKPGLTFQFPGGTDLFIIAFSFVFISTVMFATTYIVWKVGAIHFNEY